MTNYDFKYMGYTITFGEEVVANIPLHSVMIDGNLLMHNFNGKEEVKLFLNIEEAIVNTKKFVDSLVEDEFANIES